MSIPKKIPQSLLPVVLFLLLTGLSALLFLAAVTFFLELTGWAETPFPELLGLPNPLRLAADRHMGVFTGF